MVLLPGVSGFFSFDTLPLPTDASKLTEVGVEIRRQGRREFIPTGADRKRMREVFNQAAQKGGCTILIRGVGTEPQTFKARCYQAAVVEAAQVRSFLPAISGPCSFHQAELAWQKQRLFILLNWLYPLFGFATVLENGTRFYRDYEVLAKHFTPDFQVVPAAQLQQPIKIQVRKGRMRVLEPQNTLASGDVAAIWDWSKRGRLGLVVGDVLFNEWD